MDGGVWSLDGKTSVRDQVETDLSSNCQTDDKTDQVSAIKIFDCKSEYYLAEKTGIELASKIVARGAKTILEAAKKEVHSMRSE